MEEEGLEGREEVGFREGAEEEGLEGWAVGIAVGPVGVKVEG